MIEFVCKCAVLFDVQARLYDGQGIWRRKRGRKGHYCGDADLAWGTAAMERAAKRLLQTKAAR